MWPLINNYGVVNTNNPSVLTFLLSETPERTLLTFDWTFTIISRIWRKEPASTSCLGAPNLPWWQGDVEVNVDCFYEVPTLLRWLLMTGIGYHVGKEIIKKLQSATCYLTSRDALNFSGEHYCYCYLLATIFTQDTRSWLVWSSAQPPDTEQSFSHWTWEMLLRLAAWVKIWWTNMPGLTSW